MNIIEGELGVAQVAKQLEHIVKPHLDSEGRPIIPAKVHEALKIRAANATIEAVTDVARQGGLVTTDADGDDFPSLESQRENDKAFQLGARDVITSRRELQQLQRIYRYRKSKALKGLETRDIGKRNKLLENVESDLNKLLSHLNKLIEVKDEYKNRLEAAKTLLALASTPNNRAITSSSGGKLEIDADVMMAGYNVLMSTLPDKYTVRSQANSGREESDSREESIDQIVAELDTEIEVLRSEVENHKVEADLESAIIEYLEETAKDKVAIMREEKDAQGFDTLVTDNLKEAMSDVGIKDKDKIMERVKERILKLYYIKEQIYKGDHRSWLETRMIELKTRRDALIKELGEVSLEFFDTSKLADGSIVKKQKDPNTEVFRAYINFMAGCIYETKNINTLPFVNRQIKLFTTTGKNIEEKLNTIDPKLQEKVKDSHAKTKRYLYDLRYLVSNNATNKHVPNMSNKAGVPIPRAEATYTQEILNEMD